MCDALRQEHQIAIVQLLPSLGFGMDPARALTDKMKTKQLLLWKGDAPGVSELAAAIVDSTQAKILKDFTQGVHGDMRRRRRLRRTVKHLADLGAERPGGKWKRHFHSRIPDFLARPIARGCPSLIGIFMSSGVINRAATLQLKYGGT